MSLFKARLLIEPDFPPPLFRIMGAVVFLFLNACGGGDISTKTGSNGTGVTPSVPPPVITGSLVASGPLTSSGPTGIAGINWVNSGASISINTQTGSAATELRLGMFAEMTGNLQNDTGEGAAIQLQTQSTVVGPVEQINVGAQQLTILSISIQFDQNTILDGVPTLSAISVGEYLEVYGLPLPQPGSLLATRVIKRSAPHASSIEIAGAVTNFSKTQFMLQNRTIVTSADTRLLTSTTIMPSTAPHAPPLVAIPENEPVRVVGVYDKAGDVITALDVKSGLIPIRPDNNTIVLDGVVEKVTAPGHFRLNDTNVESTVPGAASVIPGMRVQVRGVKQQGVLTATEFRLIQPTERLTYTVQGNITDFQSPSNFRVNGEAINATTAILKNGAMSDLNNNRPVLIKAVAGAGHLDAVEVTFISGP